MANPVTTDLNKAQEILAMVGGEKYQQYLSTKLIITVLSIGALLYLGRANIMSVLDSVKWIAITWLVCRTAHDMMMEWRKAVVKVALVTALAGDGKIDDGDAAIIAKTE